MRRAPRAALAGPFSSWRRDARGAAGATSEPALQEHAQHALAQLHGDALVAVEPHAQALAEELHLRFGRLPGDADLARVLGLAAARGTREKRRGRGRIGYFANPEAHG